MGASLFMSTQAERAGFAMSANTDVLKKSKDLVVDVLKDMLT